MLPMISLFIYMGLSVKISLHRRRIARQLAHEPISNLESSIESSSKETTSRSKNYYDPDPEHLMDNIYKINKRKETVFLIAIVVKQFQISTKNICKQGRFLCPVCELVNHY